MRRKIFGIDSDSASPLLQQSRARQTDGAASQHCNVLFSRAVYFAAGEFTRSPGERYPCATVSVIVYHQLVVELLSFDYESGRAKWPQSDDSSYLAFGLNVDLRQLQKR